MVRFIDNFSSGERGALSAEYFYRQGYKVIFLHRSGSIMPFTRGIRQSIAQTNDSSFVTLLKMHSDGTIAVDCSQYNDAIKTDVFMFRSAQETNSILNLSFETVEEYLELLQLTAKELCTIGTKACFFLAAAVSDFYIPLDQVSLAIALV